MANCIMCGKTVNNYPGYITDGVISVCNECAASNSLMRIMTRIQNSGKPANLKGVFSPLIEVGLVNQTNGERVELDKGKLDAKRELNEKYGMAVNAYTDKELEDVEAYNSKYQPGSEFMNGVKGYLESGLVNQTDDEFSSIKERVEGLFDVCRVVWESSHDKKAVYNKFTELAKRLSEETDFSIRELGLPDPAYVRSDGSIDEVPASILSGGGSNLSFEEIEIGDDIENMSQEDFYSKYVDNQAALNMWHDYHGEPSEFMEV